MMGYLVVFWWIVLTLDEEVASMGGCFSRQFGVLSPGSSTTSTHHIRTNMQQAVDDKGKKMTRTQTKQLGHGGCGGFHVLSCGILPAFLFRDPSFLPAPNTYAAWVAAAQRLSALFLS
ncbi:hypothetical protein QBC47DRAFT_74323 [Echria macrotheca]|uniref:Secreted protein n=1 Tax=Echria macrotheca TaxID=438768 RepID=A0AAJ0B7P7_9PEZI|nr:hypothetical protein QBC47DRAFT_74323 [Echria macrotheca]